MTNSPEQVSATIHQFPPRGRFAAASPRFDRAAPPPAKVLDAAAWYHGEEINRDDARH